MGNELGRSIERPNAVLYATYSFKYELEKMTLYVHTEKNISIVRQVMQAANCAPAKQVNDRSECV